MDTSLESQLKPFAVERFHIDEPAGSYDMLQVRCPRCRAEFWVRLKWRVIYAVTGRDDDPPAYPVGRNCPECSKVSMIPEEWREIVHSTRPTKRRIVRRRRSK